MMALATETAMILNVLAEKLSRTSKDNFKGQKFRDFAHRAGLKLASALSAELL